MLEYIALSETATGDKGASTKGKKGTGVRDSYKGGGQKLVMLLSGEEDGSGE